MDHSRARVDPSVNQSLRDGVLTLAALFLVFAAFDDITTDNATSFRAEYSALIACACWLSFVAMRLISTRHLILGGSRYWRWPARHGDRAASGRESFPSGRSTSF